MIITLGATVAVLEYKPQAATSARIATILEILVAIGYGPAIVALPLYGPMDQRVLVPATGEVFPHDMDLIELLKEHAKTVTRVDSPPLLSSTPPSSTTLD